MTNFRLIAITPLADCHEKFRKKLIAGQPNILYNDYKVEMSQKGDTVLRVESPKERISDKLYTLNNGINLSISAIVGKNGTGKSTIFELLFYTIYVVYTQMKLDGKRILDHESKDLTRRYHAAVEELEAFEHSMSPFNQTDPREIIWGNGTIRTFFEFITDNGITLEPQDYMNKESLLASVRRKGRERTNALHYDIDLQKQEESRIINGLAVSIIYETDGVVKELSYDRGKFSYSSFDPERKDITSEIKGFNPEDFFYSICINYSHHGLNSNVIGNWVNKLFHKNDAYRTPVVINPMREKGTFNINREIHLAKERLMANILYDLVQGKETVLLGKYNIKHFVFSVKLRSAPLLHPYDITSLKAYPLLKDIGLTNDLHARPFWDFALSYLEQKIKRIRENYHSVIVTSTKNPDKDIKFNRFLKSDTSHITKKVRQVLNFLKHTYERDNMLWKSDEVTTKTLNAKEMMKWLEMPGLDLTSLKPYELLELGLPGFFHIDFILTRGDSGNILFSELSSGEQQMILNSNAILYHLYNLNSIHPKSEDKGEEEQNKISRIAYRNVNVVLDEVELYYHPEMQRRMVADLIQNFENIKSAGSSGISAINVVILTHSPFILSDIPKQNVLSLTEDIAEQGISQDTQTFGANIHDTLKGKFFMRSTTGEHVNELISEFLRFYNEVCLAVTDSELSQYRTKFLAQKEKYRFLIENIGEDVIRQILANHMEFLKDRLEN